MPRRPPDRPDDVAFAPWVGSRYTTSRPRVAVMMLNPGHAPASHKLARRDLLRRFGVGVIAYEEYCKQLASLIPQWGFGRVIRWFQELGLEPEKIAFLNMALCAVADDSYFPQLFESCFERHTRAFSATLEPDVVLLCGKKELSPYTGAIESLGIKVILTWHYRPMHTQAGRKELQRVRAKLDNLNC